MKRRATRRSIVGGALCAAACAGAPLLEAPAPPGAAGAPRTPPPAVDAAPSMDAVSPDAADAAAAEAPADAGEAGLARIGPPACPDGMALVEGDYCTDVEQRCVEEWFDKSNQKRVCERFEPPSRCEGARVKKRYCIDVYEWPNQKGVRPEVMNNFYQAEVKCAAVGKRLCTESEWTFACEGPEMKPFPGGHVRDARKCNGDHEWDGPVMKKVAKRDPAELARLWRGVPSGSQPECISDFGVADLPGNTDEVVASEQPRSKWQFESVHTGGPWYKGVRNQCRPKVYTHDEGFYYYFLSFRCCAEPDGQPTDPRTPRQRQDGWKFERVERLARFSVAEMRQKLELKARGECRCEPNQILCKTMCGTLLGPNARDGDDTTRMRPGGY